MNEAKFKEMCKMSFAEFMCLPISVIFEIREEMRKRLSEDCNSRIGISLNQKVEDDNRQYIKKTMGESIIKNLG